MTRKPRMAASDDQTPRFAAEATTDVLAACHLLQKAIWTAAHSPRTEPMLENLAEIQRFLATHYLRGYEPPGD